MKKPDLALLLGKPVDEDELDDDDTEQDDGERAAEVVALLDQALDKKLSDAERFDAFAEAIELCGGY